MTGGGGFRLPGGGRIDRSRRLRFEFDGRAMHGFAGDTVASALIANGVRIVGRSLKYHRPRGFFGMDVEDPNAMVEIRDAFGRDAAVRAGEVELAEGQRIATLAGWPSMRFDAGTLLGLAAPVLKAGFYYKTFMWPRWMAYEPFIRRATGFGRADVGAAARPSEQRHDVSDVLIVGGGPAGLAAARALDGSGLSVILADLSAAPGGSLLRETVSVEGVDGATWAERETARLGKAVRLLARTTVAGAYENNIFTLLQRIPAEGGVARDVLWKLSVRFVVLASGAIEQPLVFSGNDRPGVMLASAVRGFIRRYGVAPGRRIAVYTNNDSGYRTALAAAEAGLEVAAVIDTRPAPGGAVAIQTERAGIPVLAGSEVVGTKGRTGLHTVVAAPVGGGAETRLGCSILAVSGGLAPQVHLAAHRGARPAFDEESSSFVCRDLPAGWSAAGGVTGRPGAAAALRDGVAAAAAILRAAGRPPSAWTPPEVAEHPTGPPASGALATAGRPGKMWVDLQNDVTVADIDLAVREGYRSVEHLKRYTTLGMGTDQGRTSNINGIALLAGLTDRKAGDVGTTTFRPPYTAVPMSAIAHQRHGRLYRPERLMPAHAVHSDAGGVFRDFAWQRPDWYRENGADREAAAAAEVLAVRNGVGIFDGSPLGKIEVAGPDAAAFLNRFYVSDLLTLRPGRIRYSVMLREDGVVFDDGVVTCVDETLFIAGPTSGQADAVAAWFERWRQLEWPQLRVAVAPVTSAWASIALSGPKSRDLLASVGTDIDLDGKAFPHMAFRQGTVAGVPARVSRVSFTGELQFEVNVPSRYGQSLLERLREHGRSFGARLIGMEAWLRLRVEKGYLHVGTDTNSRTLPADIGMGEIAGRKPGDFIGRRSLSLPFALDRDREQLVGLRSTGDRLPVGGRILAPGAVRPPCRTEGFVSSACTSPTLGHAIGLALIERGASRHGERVRIYADGGTMEAEICAPVFYDPDNTRLKP